MEFLWPGWSGYEPWAATILSNSHHNRRSTEIVILHWTLPVVNLTKNLGHSEKDEYLHYFKQTNFSNFFFNLLTLETILGMSTLNVVFKSGTFTIMSTILRIIRYWIITSKTTKSIVGLYIFYLCDDQKYVFSGIVLMLNVREISRSHYMKITIRDAFGVW